MTELASFDLVEVEVKQLKPETALDGLETTTQRVGQAALRELVKQYQQAFPPEAITLDGYDSLKVVSRFGVLELPRRVGQYQPSQSHSMPGNAVLPEHQGTVITRGLQEWACLLPQDLPFEAVERLLGWQTQEGKCCARPPFGLWFASIGS